MGEWSSFWSETDAVGRAVAVVMALLSLSSWILILWKSWVLARVRADVAPALQAFWAAPDWTTGRERLVLGDREGVVLPLLDAARSHDAAASVAGSGPSAARITRRLRQALQGSLSQLRMGQVWLASIGSTAPFIGLFGTVWGIYHALVDLSVAGTLTVDKVAGPVGEALIMTAAGLAVAIPAVLAFNLLGKRIAAIEADLEGYAHDLMAWLEPGA